MDTLQETQNNTGENLAQTTLFPDKAMSIIITFPPDKEFTIKNILSNLKWHCTSCVVRK